MQVIIASVTLTVPNHMTSDNVIRELHSSVGFGNPQIAILHISDVPYPAKLLCSNTCGP